MKKGSTEWYRYMSKLINTTRKDIMLINLEIKVDRAYRQLHNAFKRLNYEKILK